MSFHETRFPANLSFGAIGGPERRTDIVTLANGFEERNTPWAHSRRRYDAGLGLRSLDDLSRLVEFFEARQGQLFGFRWKDWADYKSCAPCDAPGDQDQQISVGDGAQSAIALTKTYTSGGQSYVRPVKKPVLGTVLVAVSGVAQQESIDYSVDYAAGIIQFASAPEPGAAITAGFEFDVPVRFDTDRIATAVSSFQAGEAPAVPVVEVRV